MKNQTLKEYPTLVYHTQPPMKRATLSIRGNEFVISLDKGKLSGALPDMYQYITSHQGIEDTAHSMSFNDEFTINTDYINHSDFEQFLKSCFEQDGYELVKE